MTERKTFAVGFCSDDFRPVGMIGHRSGRAVAVKNNGTVRGNQRDAQLRIMAFQGRKKALTRNFLPGRGELTGRFQVILHLHAVDVEEDDNQQSRGQHDGDRADQQHMFFNFMFQSDSPFWFVRCKTACFYRARCPQKAGESRQDEAQPVIPRFCSRRYARF